LNSGDFHLPHPDRLAPAELKAASGDGQDINGFSDDITFDSIPENYSWYKITA
jgi:hypothetical protein